MPESTPALHPDRNLALELVRVTEAAVMVAGRWVGRARRTGPTGRAGEKNRADGAAAAAMRALIVMRGRSGTIRLLESHHVQDRTAGPQHPAEL